MTRFPPPLTPDLCLFLDVDGTLIEFTDTPSQTMGDARLRELLARASERLGGAVALVSGREIKTLDALFAPLILPASGLHGGERRGASGAVHGAAFIDPALDGARVALQAVAAALPGTIVEDKGRTVAIHYRMAPQFEANVKEAVHTLAQALRPAFLIQPGNLMFEIKPAGFTKGSAVRAFMGETPFIGRRPVFIGDDLTDQDGFDAVDGIGGLSIGVGERVAGRYHLDDVAAVREWLTTMGAG